MEQFYEGLHEALTVYVRALAWWHAAPKPKPSNLKKLKNAPEPDRVSRLKMRLDAGGEIDLPDIDPALLHFVSVLMEAGPVSSAGMGPIPLTWAELDAWQHCVGLRLQPWEARLIRVLSGDYLEEFQQAEAHDAPPPWIQESTAERRSKVARHIRNILRG